MRARTAAWTLIFLYAFCLGVIAALAAVGTAIPNVEDFLIVGTAFAGVGGVLVLRRPNNSIGWLCLVAAVFGASGLGARTYATHALTVATAALPGGHIAAWWSGWTTNPTFFVLSLFLPLLFPTGRPPSSRWRPVVWASAVCLGMTTAGTAFTPGPFAAAPEFENPFPLDLFGAPWAPVARDIVFGAEVVLTLLALASLVARYRHALAVERQQLKWFTWSFAFAVLVLMLGSAIEAVIGMSVSRVLPWWGLLWPLSAGAMAVAIGTAILRYRLYEIDVLINRTLVYGALTVSLAITYFATVVALQTVLRPFTGGSELPVALSTLAVVGLFTPLRRRIRSAVDRRFYRSRYDAQRTLDAFSAQLRDEVALDAVRADLLEAVRETLQPAHASLWLRADQPASS